MRGEVYPSPDGWRFRVRGTNGEIMATGEAYVRRIDAESALKQLFSGERFDVTVRNHANAVVDHFMLPTRPGNHAALTHTQPAETMTPDIDPDPRGDQL